MKTKFLLAISAFSMLFFTFSSFKSVTISNDIVAVNLQESIVNATYDGHESYGYNFIGKHTDGEEFTITFQKVNEAVSKEFDLESDALIKSKFKITYTTKVTVTKDADGYEDEEEINTIIKLEKL
jgi:hypothetical protein